MLAEATVLYIQVWFLSTDKNSHKVHCLIETSFGNELQFFLMTVLKDSLFYVSNNN